MPDPWLSDFTTVAEGLHYPEGPVFTDAGVLLVEVQSGDLCRIDPTTGAREHIAALGGGPNGAAIGPDGAIYVCNNGGMAFFEFDGLTIGLDQSKDYKSGSLQRVQGSEFRTIAESFEPLPPFFSKPGAAPPQEPLALRGPDDLVFDESGGLWVTDWGKTRGRVRDWTSVYYRPAGNDSLQEKIFPLEAPNGIALSPKQDRVYVSETYSRRVLYWELGEPGEIILNPRTVDGSYLLTADIGGILDSMAVDADGNVYVATMMQNHDPTQPGGITIISPDAEVMSFIPIDVGGIADPFPSNICFGGPDMKTAFITLASTGRLVTAKSAVGGLPLAFSL